MRLRSTSCDGGMRSSKASADQYSALASLMAYSAEDCPAGFEYRPIRRVEDMPECFSRPICRLAMQLNDTATDAQRQRLLPFVTRLACADTTEIERKRASYILSLIHI